MKAYSLFSGSSGNCFFVSEGKTKLLIDCGVSARAAERALLSLGTSLSEIDAIFVTHEHSDHTKGLEIIAKNHGIPTYMTEPTARALIKDPACALIQNLVLFDGEYSTTVGEVKVSSFLTPHDCARSVGYTVSGGGKKIGFATDMGCIEESVATSLCECNSVVIEANHDVNMLTLGPYPYELKCRIKSAVGHLSNDDCGRLCRMLAACGTGSFLLAHISKENNTPALAVETVKNQLCDFPEIIVSAAGADSITELVIL